MLECHEPEVTTVSFSAPGIPEKMQPSAVSEGSFCDPTVPKQLVLLQTTGFLHFCFKGIFWSHEHKKGRSEASGHCHLFILFYKEWKRRGEGDPGYAL